MRKVNPLLNLPVETTEAYLKGGMYWVEFKDGNFIQCCLVEDEDEDGGPTGSYLLAIDAEDCGHEWGTCGDVNRLTLSRLDNGATMDDVLEALLHYAKKDEIALENYYE